MENLITFDQDWFGSRHEGGHACIECNFFFLRSGSNSQVFRDDNKHIVSRLGIRDSLVLGTMRSLLRISCLEFKFRCPSLRDQSLLLWSV